MQTNGQPYPMPSSHPTGHEFASRLGALEASQGISRNELGTIFGWLRDLEGRVKTLEVKARLSRSLKGREREGWTGFLREVIRPLRDLIWALLFLLAGLGMITLDRPPAISINATVPSSDGAR